MSTKTKEAKTEKATQFKVETIEISRDKKETRKTHYEGDDEKEAEKKMLELRKTDHPHVEYTHPKRKLIYVYKKRPGEKNYKLSGKEIKA